MDIVEQLRHQARFGAISAAKTRLAAADEIEQLRESLRMMPKTIIDAVDEIKRLREVLQKIAKACGCKEKCVAFDSDEIGCAQWEAKKALKEKSDDK